jgi:putative IMPACT (imprinted ancient) family translation regulator
VCYAWQLGVEQASYRANDDGEPNNSAGMPIYGQIQSFDVTNVLIAVVRVFGGTKLGVGGLISAYRNAAKLALEEAIITEKTIEEQLLLKFEYAEMDLVMRFIKKNQLNIFSQELNLDCEIVISVRKSKVESVVDNLKTFHKIQVSKID